ncbi:carbohydrate kinase family protein [Actinophytocola gossypii]|uniref:Carbohydrate kinase n=1 Tax=Actinophytocola gossypii TaxID=2812003 RepID=A0ABT2J4Y8_9PSEU|nr:carbohydrate kinase [Actinophytocola gossypii]MCT2582746.1 carbohydrate kinase [Actinophytocola gossypii]
MICVGGEALVDLVPASSARPGELGPLLPLPGGGPYNTAIALGRLGGPVAFLSRLSTDTFGDALLGRLHASGVDTALVQRGDEPTTLAVAGIGPDGSARYSFHVEGTADRVVADPGELPADVTTVSLGTLGMVLEPGATTYETVLRRHSARGGLVVLDPNIRAAMITDPDAYRARFDSWLPDVGLLKLSLEDAEWLAGGMATEAAVRGWLDRGPAAAVLTRGAAGLLALTADGDRIEVPTVPVAVVDTIGAGDTVHGALLFWLNEAGITGPAGVREIDADGWRAALEFASRAASVTVSRAGAEPPYATELGIHP